MTAGCRVSLKLNVTDYWSTENDIDGDLFMKSIAWAVTSWLFLCVNKNNIFAMLYIVSSIIYWHETCLRHSVSRNGDGLYILSDTCENFIRIPLRKTAVSPLPTHWGYCDLELSNQLGGIYSVSACTNFRSNRSTGISGTIYSVGFVGSKGHDH